MKITRIKAQNFIGLRSLDVALDQPVTVFAGKNGAGKSSIRDAIRFAFLGEPGRVKLKRDHADLITHGAKGGSVTIETDEGTWVGKIKGDSSRPEIPDALPYVLDAQRFASLDAKERRTFLSSLLGVSAKPEMIQQMARERGCDMQLYEQVKPMLRSGFDAAHTDCKSRASEAKGAWKQITGETWGSAKGEDWQPESPADGADPESLMEREAKLIIEGAAIEDRIAKARARLENAGRMERLREAAAKAPQIEQESRALASRLTDLQERHDQLRAASANTKGGQTIEIACPDCGVLTRYVIDRGKAVPVPDDQSDPVVDDDLVAVRAEIGQVEQQLETSRRDLAQANNARTILAEDAEADSEITEADDIEVMREQLAKTNDQISQARAERRAIEAAAKAEQDAARAHTTITAWLALADAFAPDGIPGELLSRTIKPINDRLRESAEHTGWPQVAIDNGMTIAADGRRYELLSESEQWRCDAMIVEAIAHLSELRLMVLDRMDVLDLLSRERCLEWLSGVCGKIHDTVIVMATLKAAPVGFAPNVSAYWLDSGRVVEDGRAAA